MSVIVDIIDTFPTHDILAVGRVELDSTRTINGVLLKIDDEAESYVVDFPRTIDGRATIEVNDEVNQKILDAMVYKYERFIMSIDFTDISSRIPYIYKMEKERIRNIKGYHYA
ncbi:hypothetical protein [Ornithinibacillus sp. FSL M8-0202]|uniref:hypothetical protein n=1 Tax=Ornithinibacillus sp. FSL M8-0202 TaxID=2921616 RepID=UPI0030D45986